MITYFLITILLAPILMTTGAILKNQASIFDSPGFLRRMTTYHTTNIAQTSDTTDFTELKTPVFQQKAETIFQYAIESINELGWEITEKHPTQFQIKAVVTTPLFRFCDDVNIHIKQINSEQSALTIISSSRIGRGDLGANAGHILCLLKLLKEKS